MCRSRSAHSESVVANPSIWARFRVIHAAGSFVSSVFAAPFQGQDFMILDELYARMYFTTLKTSFRQNLNLTREVSLIRKNQPATLILSRVDGISLVTW
jgi:hypothetical protein